MAGSPDSPVATRPPPLPARGVGEALVKARPCWAESWRCDSRAEGNRTVAQSKESVFLEPGTTPWKVFFYGWRLSFYSGWRGRPTVDLDTQAPPTRIYVFTSSRCRCFVNKHNYYEWVQQHRQGRAFFPQATLNFFSTLFEIFEGTLLREEAFTAGCASWRMLW